MDEFQRKTVAIALKRMFTGQHFSICVVDACLKVSGCIPNKKDYDTLSALHCVNWSEMDADFRDQVLLKVAQIFTDPGMNIEFIEEAIAHDPKLLN